MEGSSQLRAQDLHAQQISAVQVGLRFLVVPLVTVDLPEVSDSGDGARVLFAQNMLSLLKGCVELVLGLAVLPLVPEQAPEVGHGLQGLHTQAAAHGAATADISASPSRTKWCYSRTPSTH